jgi:coenzyme F420-reducing hydrogenase delta subunit
MLYALLNGTDHVLLALRPPVECQYEYGNRFAEMRIENVRASSRRAAWILSA